MRVDRGVVRSAGFGALVGLAFACAGPSFGELTEDVVTGVDSGPWRAETRTVRWSGDLPWATGERAGLALVHADGEWLRLELPPGATVEGAPTWSDGRARWATSLGAIEIGVGETVRGERPEGPRRR